MKKLSLGAFCVLLTVIIVGIASAGEMKGDVTAMDSKTGSFSVKVDNTSVQFESEAGVVPKNVGVNDKVSVKYEEVNGKKKATKVVKIPTGC